MERENLHTAIVERVVAGGLGLARLNGKIVFLPGVLPGEEVRIEVLSARNDYLTARPVEIIHEHPRRRKPPCSLFLTCGGCHLMHAAYQDQLDMKVDANLGKILEGKAIVPEVVASPFEFFYRDRVRLQLKRTRGRLRAGFYLAGSKQLIPTTFCHQVNPRINSFLPALNEWLGSIPSSDNEPSQLEILAGAPEEDLRLIMSLNRKPSDRMSALLVAGPDSSEPYQLFTSVKGNIHNVKAKGKDDGLTWLTLDSEEIVLKALPGAFTQVNRSVNELLVKGLLDTADKLGVNTVLDLYSGLGNFSIPLAKRVKSVTGVEESEAAIASARLNAKINRMKNVRLIRDKAERAVHKLVREGERYDLVLMDPPRAGAKGLGIHINQLDPKAVIYISCHPAALNRDLTELASLGFSPESLTVYDMFPQTSHVEVMAVLLR